MAKTKVPSGLSDEQLRCQTINHPWDDDPIPRPEGRRTIYSLALWYRCPSCQKIKMEAYDVYGNVIYRRYIDPPNWVKVPRDISRGHLRTIFRKQMFAEAKRRNLPLKVERTAI